MIKILYDRGSTAFSSVLMMGITIMPAPYTTQVCGESVFASNSVLCGVNYSNENSSNFGRPSDSTSDPLTIFLLKQPADLITIAKPRTELGRKLLEYREAALVKGVRMLSIDEIDAMVNEGRGSFA